MPHCSIFFITFLCVASTLAAEIRFDSLLVHDCTKSNEKPSCSFEWKNTTIWVGGKVPGINDDIIIDAPTKIFTLLCTSRSCKGRNVVSNARTLTIRNSATSGLIFDTWAATNLNSISGGSFNATRVTVVGQNLAGYLSLEQTISSFDVLEAENINMNLTTLNVNTFNVSYVSVYGTDLTVNDYADISTIWTATESNLYFMGTCAENELNGSGQTFTDTYMYTTTACLSALSQDAQFINTEWDIEATEDTPKVYKFPDYITLDLTKGSTINLYGNIELQIDTTVSSSDDSGVTAWDDGFVNLLENGYLSGRSSYPDMIANTGTIEANDGHFYVLGKLTVGKDATIYIKDDGYVLSYQLVLDQPALNFSSARVGSFMNFNKNKLSGTFGSINMNYLPYVVGYDSNAGYIGVSLNIPPSSAPVGGAPITVQPPQEPPVSEPPVMPPVIEAPATTPSIVEPPVTSSPQAEPVAEPVAETPIQISPVSTPESAAQSPIALALSDKTTIIVLSAFLAAAVIGLVALGVLYKKARTQGYERIINDPTI